jgi:hypothetical protein
MNKDNILIVATAYQGHQELGLLNEAINFSRKGANVVYVNCDRSIGGCLHNPCYNKIYCCLCSKVQKANNKRYLPESVQQLSITDVIKQEKIQTHDLPKYDYESLEELKKVTYKGIDIGYGAVSSYISLTRNLYPKIDNELKRFLDALLQQQIILTEVMESLTSRYAFDMIVFHNGRLAQYKPVLGAAVKRGIPFLCTEGFVDGEGNIFKNNFYNSIPHDIQANLRRYNELWDMAKSKPKEREVIARSFFENRRNAKWSGDTVYTLSQKSDLMPNNWDPHKVNITIFNSSEDEYFSIGKEYDEDMLFKSQILGIRTIVEHYLNDKTKHFYLRVHPNLSNITYSYHTKLYEWNYPNLTVIKADSPISTYAMMDSSDKIIVFNSTMGIESVYWRKAVICLSHTVYKKMNVVYAPTNQEELWNYIESDNLPCLYNEDVLKFGFYYMSKVHDSYENVPTKMRKINFRTHIIRLFRGYKIFGSEWLHWFFYNILNRMIMLSRLTSKFKKIPREEVTVR